MDHDCVWSADVDDDLRGDRPGGRPDLTFGETLSGPLAHIVVRNWGALIAIVGAMLIYGAFDPPTRSLVLIVAGVSKAIFIGLVLSLGGRYLGHQAGVAVAIDSLMVAVFAWYLFATRSAADE